MKERGHRGRRDSLLFIHTTMTLQRPQELPEDTQSRTGGTHAPGWQQYCLPTMWGQPDVSEHPWVNNKTAHAKIDGGRRKG